MPKSPPLTGNMDPEYQRAVAPFANIRLPTPRDAATLRVQNNAATDAIMHCFPCPEARSVLETKLQYTTADGTELALHRFDPPPASSASSPLVRSLRKRAAGIRARFRRFRNSEYWSRSMTSFAAGVSGMNSATLGSGHYRHRSGDGSGSGSGSDNTSSSGSGSDNSSSSGSGKSGRGKLESASSRLESCRNASSGPSSESAHSSIESAYSSADELSSLEMQQIQQLIGEPGTDNTTGACESGTHKRLPSPPRPPLQPAILYIHGGGLVSGSVAHFRRDILRYAHATGMPVFAPAYRLAPEHEYPRPLHDVYAALCYLRDHADQLRIDPTRIAVLGVSAGGGLAAGTALMARDQGFVPPIKKLVLVQPMLDDRSRLLPESHLCADLTWSDMSNQIGWHAYLGSWAGVGDRGKDKKVPGYAVPNRADDLRGLPSTFIDVGELDLFRNECLEFATRMHDAGGVVEFYLHPGVPHSWEWFAPNAAVTKRAFGYRINALRDLQCRDGLECP